MKMLKELKGKLVTVSWRKSHIMTYHCKDYRMEDYCQMKDDIWIKLRRTDNPKQMAWYRFDNLETIGRVP